jgi:hypothetical protein
MNSCIIELTPITGIAYRTGTIADTYTNNLVLGSKYESDAKLIKELGANTIRAYTTDSTLNMDACMKAFEDVEIHVMVDITAPDLDIDKDNPGWNVTLRDQSAKVLDGMTSTITCCSLRSMR